MHLLKQFEQVAIFDPTNPNQRVVNQRVGVPGGWGSFFFNEVPVTAQLKGLRDATGFSWATLPAWVQIGVVGLGSAALGYLAMKRYGDSTIKPALRKVGINLSGLSGARSGRYIVHGHMVRRDGRQDSFWTRTGLTKSAAQRLAREQRRDGGVARVQRG